MIRTPIEPNKNFEKQPLTTKKPMTILHTKTITNSAYHNKFVTDNEKSLCMTQSDTLPIIWPHIKAVKPIPMGCDRLTFLSSNISPGRNLPICRPGQNRKQIKKIVQRHLGGNGYPITCRMIVDERTDDGQNDCTMWCRGVARAFRGIGKFDFDWFEIGILMGLALECPRKASGAFVDMV